MSRKFTFIFTEDFFDIASGGSVNTDRFRDIRNTFKNVGQKRGERGERLGDAAFDVEVAIIDRGFSCIVTNFEELNEVPFASNAVLYGMGNDVIESDKAKFQLEAFFSEKRALGSLSTLKMLAERRKRSLVLVVESPADLKRPSLEPILKLRSQLSKVMINPIRGPIVDCQVSKIFQEGNSSSLSTLLNMFCVHYK
jgi:hypothetical protein